MGKAATSLTPLVNALAVSAMEKNEQQRKSFQPNLVVPAKFNFGGAMPAAVEEKKAEEPSAVEAVPVEGRPGLFQFKATPTAPASFRTPQSIRKRSSVLFSSERGSASERRRRRKGLNPFDGFVDFTGIPADPMSPMHARIRYAILSTFRMG